MEVKRFEPKETDEPIAFKLTRYTKVPQHLKNTAKRLLRGKAEVYVDLTKKNPLTIWAKEEYRREKKGKE